MWIISTSRSPPRELKRLVRRNTNQSVTTESIAGIGLVGKIVTDRTDRAFPLIAGSLFKAPRTRIKVALSEHEANEQTSYRDSRFIQQKAPFEPVWATDRTVLVASRGDIREMHSWSCA